MDDDADFEIAVSIAGATTNYLMDLAQASRLTCLRRGDRCVPTFSGSAEA